MKNFSLNPVVFFCLLCSFIVNSGTAQNSIKDLVGARGSSVEGEMTRKGFVFIRTDKSNTGINEFWWKNSNRKCAIVRLVNGKVAAVTTTVPADCNKGNNSANNNRPDHNGNYGYNPNYSGDPKLGDLKGWKADRAYREIGSRGYRHVKDYRNNGKLVKVWYNSKYKKCKKTAEKNGNIDLVDNSKQCGQ